MCQNDWRHWGDENDVFGWHPNAVLNGLSDDDFHGFIRNVMAKHPGYVTELYGMYAQPQVWFWGKQENLAEDLITVLRRLEVDFDEDRVRDAGPVNISDRRPITWDESLWDQMLRLEHAALVRYGYPTA